MPSKNGLPGDPQRPSLSGDFEFLFGFKGVVKYVFVGFDNGF